MAEVNRLIENIRQEKRRLDGRIKTLDKFKLCNDLDEAVLRLVLKQQSIMLGNILGDVKPYE